jgi:hypothetical protein
LRLQWSPAPPPAERMRQRLRVVPPCHLRFVMAKLKANSVADLALIARALDILPLRSSPLP